MKKQIRNFLQVFSITCNLKEKIYLKVGIDYVISLRNKTITLSTQTDSQDTVRLFFVSNLDVKFNKELLNSFDEDFSSPQKFEQPPPALRAGHLKCNFPYCKI